MTTTSNTLRGTPVVPGVAYGPVARVSTEIPLSAVDAYGLRPPGDPEELLAEYDSAVGMVTDSLHARSVNASGSAAEVLVATAALARDKGLRRAVRKRLEAGDPLLTAVSGAVGEFTALFTRAGGLMAERVTDLEDIGRRITARIVGVEEPGLVLPAEPGVLVAEDLAPADTAGLDPVRVLALVTERGGPTSHTAIIARQLGLPCVVGASGVTSIADGTRVLVDAASGTIESEPDETHANRRVVQDRAWRERLATWSGPARTADGAAVKLLANVADGRSARAAAPTPVQGAGLFRTELCFLGRETEPDVETQAAIYAEVLTSFDAGRTVVIRTLDAGSDKPIPYATSAGEDNPALGVRGLRLSFGNPGLLERQLDAVALAAATTGTSPWVMAPMVATVDEAAGFAARVRSRGLIAGIMVETPAAALLADRILEAVDFVSIGTNDLTQYAMAADRLAADLAHLTDPWQPAVLRLVAMTAEAGRRLGKPVGVCGEAAADPLLAAVLVGLGVTSLSMAPAAVPAVGVQLESVTVEECREAAENVLEAVDPQEAREFARAVLTPS
ncbi:phosphoenolpyruvate-protein phosphotransferase [Streptomyces humidus]|uniref:Phosphoenolpyruvate-protein phosphotransferase n=1 Tax=Streptomyces humidus TaxID=52259 RepID=A0A918LCD6_9ACTN|nr:putative PEP-binding protein [Streptomyces humidus]GGS30594.1 phosphoenolpyruvate-protein phosphotransferase [Streptomyces humidus]